MSKRGHGVFYASGLAAASAAMYALSTAAGAAAIPPVLIAIMIGIAPALYIPNYEFIIRFGGPYVGTLASIKDFSGNVVTTAVFALYPLVLQAGGWSLLFKVYSGMIAASAACFGLFAVLEARDPLVHSPFER